MKQLMTIALLLLTVVASAQIPINTNFQVSTPNPIDGRMTIATLSDTSTITDLYDGLLTVVQDTDEIWQYDGTQWVQFSGGTDDQTAAEVPAADAGKFFDGTDVEAQLQEIAPRTCYTVPITFSDGQDDIAVIDSAMARYDCIIIGTSTSDTIDISRPIEVPRNNMRLIINGYVRVMAGDSVAITQRINTADTIIHVTSTANYSAGQWVTMVDTIMPFQIGSTQTRRQGVSSKIVEVLSDTTFKIDPPFFDMNQYYLYTRDYVDPVDEGRVGQQNSCIVLTELENIIIEGNGILDVNRQNSLYATPLFQPENFGWAEGIRMSSGIGVLGCRNVKISGVSTINPGLHGYAFRGNNNVFCQNIKAYETHDKGLLWFAGDTITVKGFYSQNNVKEDGLSIYGGVNTGYFEDIHIVGAKRNPILFRINGNGGVTLNGVKLENCTSSVGIVMNSGDKNATISNVTAINCPNAIALALLADNVVATNIVVDSCLGVASIGGNNISVSNFSATGKGIGEAFRIGGNNASISNGSIDNFDDAFDNTGGTSAKISNVSITNTPNAKQSGLNAGYVYSNVSGLRAANNWPYSNTGGNLDLFTRYISGNFFFSEPNESGLGLSTKFTFLDRNNSYSPLNTLNVRGGLTLTGGTQNLIFGSSSSYNFAIGVSNVIPENSAYEHYIMDYASTLTLGSSRAGNDSWQFYTGNNEHASIYSNANGNNIAIGGGTADDNQLSGYNSDNAGLIFSNNSKPRAFFDGFTSAPGLIFRRGRGTGAIPEPSQSGDILGRIQAYGAREDSTFIVYSVVGAAIDFVAAEDHLTTGAYGTDIVFGTSPIGAGSVTEKARIPANGGLSVGSGAFTAAAGVINAQTGFRINNTATAGQYLRGNGTNIVLSAIQESDLPTRPATDVTAADAGGYFDGTDMEAVTQELGADLYDQANLRALLGIQRGAVSSSTDASGQISVGHGLSSTPTAVIVTSTTNDSWIAVVVAKNSTQFTVKFFDETGAAVASTSAGFDWVAIE